MIKVKNVEFSIKYKNQPDYDIVWWTRYCINYPIEIPDEIWEAQSKYKGSPVSIFLLGWFYRYIKDTDLYKDIEDIEKIRVKSWNIDD